MNWSELVAATAERAGLSQADARRALNAMRDTVIEQLAQGERVTLHNLGTFESRERKARVIRNIGDFRKMYLGPARRVVFRPAQALKRELQDPDPNWKKPEHQAAWRLAEALVGDLDLYHADQAPKDVGGSDTQVRSACSEAFGATWDSAVESYRTQVHPEVLSAQDYLASAARKRWS
ncbi:MAG: HU family DNA-binding protein [Myxococcota bacterium]|nr:HU family DNA-binding protein [Myxococcota bacterium]